MPVQNKIISKFFSREEVLSSEKFYRFIQRKKIVVFVPYDYVEKVTAEMSSAGAGLIGNYEMCSFRTKGTGTFKPNEKAKPFSGKKKFLSRVEEAKLEMECSGNDVNKIVDALLQNHPYEEAAYEIYDFRKREIKETGLIVNLKYGIELPELFKRINKKISGEEKGSEDKVKRIAVTDKTIDETVFDSAKFTNCEIILSTSNKNYKLFKL